MNKKAYICTFLPIPYTATFALCHQCQKVAQSYERVKVAKFWSLVIMVFIVITTEEILILLQRLEVTRKSNIKKVKI